MAKKEKSKKPFEHVLTPADVSPGPLAYASATLLVAGRWIKQHRLVAIVLFIILAGGSGIFVYQANRTPKNLADNAIITHVNKVLTIEGDANPVILTVEDESKANQAQPFLDIAVNGDKVLLYYKAKKAVLFRPSSGEIVRQGSFTPPNAKIFIRKGAADNSKVSELEAKLDQVKEIEVVSQDNSPKSDYTGLILVSVTDRYDEKLRELEAVLGVKTVRIPPGETFPDADIMIIVGS